MSNRIIFIIGGARSGKSSFTLNEASKIEGQKAYIATAEALDNEMKKRIEKHKKLRGDEWDTYEEPVKIIDVLADIKNKYSVVVLDCLTIWLSNLLIRHQNTEPAYRTGRHRTQTLNSRAESTEHPGLAPRSGAGRIQTLENSIQEFINVLKQFKDSSVCALCSGFCSLFVVSNEVGMGIVPENKMAREFRDLAGFLNQKVAEIADEVYLLTAGIPIKIKNAK